LHRKNLELDALGRVWCSGGCEDGMNRYSRVEITEEQVAFLELNAKRARTYYNSRQCKLHRGKTERCSGCASEQECKAMVAEELDGK
jgi:hypothetical protein